MGVSNEFPDGGTGLRHLKAKRHFCGIRLGPRNKCVLLFLVAIVYTNLFL
jgi:hypothetical protein